jgi:hypothetical protein
MRKISKVILGILALLLIIILFISSEDIGSIFLMTIGILALIASIFLSNDVKKLNNSSFSKILSVILINTLLYSTSLLFYGLGNIGVGDKGLLFLFTLYSYLILLVISIIVGIILVLRNKEISNQGNPNKILTVILFLFLTTLFSTTIISGIARIAQSPSLCLMHIEIKNDSFIFKKEEINNCIFQVALDTSSVTYCKQIKENYKDVANSEKNICILNVARNLGDKNICYQITNDTQRQGDCIRYIAEDKADLSMCEIPGIDHDMCYSNIARGGRDKGNPEICNYIKNNEAKYHCFSIIAIDKKDASICEKYFPSDEILISEGVNPSDYSKSECVVDANNGYF